MGNLTAGVSVVKPKAYVCSDGLYKMFTEASHQVWYCNCVCVMLFKYCSIYVECVVRNVENECFTFYLWHNACSTPNRGWRWSVRGVQL